jgi:hypothetical protein
MIKLYLNNYQIIICRVDWFARTLMGE